MKNNLINFDKVKAIMLSIDKKLGFFPPNQQTSQIIPEPIRDWYINEYPLRKKGIIRGREELEQVFSVDDSYNMYYPSPRTIEEFLFGVDNPERTINECIEDMRKQMIRIATKTYTERILQGIEIVPLSLKRVEKGYGDEFQLTAEGVALENIGISIDHDHRLSIKISRQGRELYTDVKNSISSILYSGNVTVPNEEEPQQTKKRLFSFRKREQLTSNSNHEEPVSIIHDYTKCHCDVYGSVYDGGGVYVFYKDDDSPNSFEINYYDESTIRYLLSYPIEKDSSLNFWTTLLNKQAPLTKDFCAALKEIGIFPNKHASAKCNSAQMQEYANNAYRDPSALMEVLSKKIGPQKK